jgi:spore coat protein U-like protein
VPWATAAAATAVSTFAVSVTIPSLCLVSAANLAFGAYTGAQVDATSDIAVTCPPSTHFAIGLDSGTAPGASVTTRQMTGPGGAVLAYALYQNPARTANWGNTVGVDTNSGNGNGKPKSFTVYGRVRGGQSVTPGAYADTIVVTVTY